MEQVTKRQALLEALSIFENQIRGMSKNGRMLEPLKGYEERFRDAQEKAERIREIIHALESEPVRRSMANWQIEIMEGKRPDITLLDRVQA